MPANTCEHSGMQATPKRNKPLSEPAIARLAKRLFLTPDSGPVTREELLRRAGRPGDDSLRTSAWLSNMLGPLRSGGLIEAARVRTGKNGPPRLGLFSLTDKGRLVVAQAPPAPPRGTEEEYIVLARQLFPPNGPDTLRREDLLARAGRSSGSSGANSLWLSQALKPLRSLGLLEATFASPPGSRTARKEYFRLTEEGKKAIGWPAGSPVIDKEVASHEADLEGPPGAGPTFERLVSEIEQFRRQNPHAVVTFQVRMRD